MIEGSQGVEAVVQRTRHLTQDEGEGRGAESFQRWSGLLRWKDKRRVTGKERQECSR